MADTFPDLKGDPIEDIRADIDNIPRDNDSNGLTYYVDGNAGSDGYDGLSWWTEPGTLKGPKKTLAAAITASNLTIATHPFLAGAGFAARNEIHIKGDMLVEDLTVLANKCDIVGEGSHDANPMATIQGNHAIAGAAHLGCRFINVRFTVPSGGGDIFTIPTTTSGQAFIDCVFNAHQSTKAGGAIVATASHALKVQRCRFIGAFSDAVIELGAGAINDCILEDNYIEGANQGIDVSASLTMTLPQQGYIRGNTFKTTLACINDASGLFVLAENNGVTLAARGINNAGAVVGSRALSVNNYFTCSDVSFVWPVPMEENEHGGNTYYVDLNVTASGEGLSWDTAYGTIAEAITASNVSIAANRHWARRNIINVVGDGITEDLTVLPEKCDIVGWGSDLYNFPRVIGNHVIAAAKVGCRFIKMGFISATAGDVFAIPAGCFGLTFEDCLFIPAVGGSTKAIEIASAALVTIKGCRIIVGAGDMTNIFGVAISCEGLIGHETTIEGNHIQATAGIAIVEAAGANHGSIIKNNDIDATDLAIDDNSDDYLVRNNTWTTDIDTSTSTDGYDFNLALAAGNIQNGASGLCDSVPFVKIAE